MAGPLLTRHFGRPGRERIDAYLETGGYQAATTVLTQANSAPQAVLTLLRG